MHAWPDTGRAKPILFVVRMPVWMPLSSPCKLRPHALLEGAMFSSFSQSNILSFAPGTLRDSFISVGSGFGWLGAWSGLQLHVDALSHAVLLKD